MNLKYNIFSFSDMMQSRKIEESNWRMWGSKLRPLKIYYTLLYPPYSLPRHPPHPTQYHPSQPHLPYPTLLHPTPTASHHNYYLTPTLPTLSPPPYATQPPPHHTYLHSTCTHPISPKPYISPPNPTYLPFITIPHFTLPHASNSLLHPPHMPTPTNHSQPLRPKPSPTPPNPPSQTAPHSFNPHKKTEKLQFRTELLFMPISSKDRPFCSISPKPPISYFSTTDR